MADGCCSARSCVVKKRFYKRELQKWAKNALYLVGLELVAKEVIGHKKWQRLSVPFGDSAKSEASRETVDWSPNQKCCIFCVDRQDEPDLFSVDGVSNDEGSRAGSPWSLASDEPLDLSVNAKTRHLSNGDTNGMSTASLSSFLKVPRIPEKSGRHQKRRPDAATLMPISLHQASSSTTVTTTNSDSCTAGVSSAAAAAAAAALARRAYTDDELQLALRDIQDGKLGTRRAAILYGIPRSTLRNKVYKMTMERPENDSKLDENGWGANDGNNSTDSTMPPLTLDDLVGTNVATSSEATPKGGQLSASESLKRLLRNRMAERLASENKRADQMKLSLLPDLIRKLSEERFEQECNRSRTRERSAAAMSSSESFILKIPSYRPAKSRLCNEGGDVAASVATYSSQSKKNHRAVVTNSKHSNGADNKIGVALREIISKSVMVEHGEIVENDDDNSSVRPSKKSRFSMMSSSCNSSSSAKRGLDQCPPSTSKVSRTTTSAQDCVVATRKLSSSTGKRMRAKRGRYRNYDRDNLMEAVRAVRRGEMSVHRAGSYYGVPHSTLEYKVKERHLMRPTKKRRSVRNRSVEGGGGPAGGRQYSPHPSTSSKSSFVDSTAGSSSGGGGDDGGGSSFGEEEDYEKSSPSAVRHPIGSAGSCAVVTGKKGQHPTTSNVVPASVSANANVASSLSSTTSSTAAPLWPFALDFTSLNSSNFFASQMMRKLQEDAMTHAAAAAAATEDPSSVIASTTTNGIDNSRDALLLGVLIRNGLQIQATGRK